MMNKKYAVCSLDCPDTCALEITLDARQTITNVTGQKQHPVTQGTICNKVRHLAERVYHPRRVLTPLKRVGAKGTGQFTEITWDEALDTIYERFQACIAEYGAESILPYSFAGTMGIINHGSMDRRFFHRLGASKLERTICSTAGNMGYTYTMGVNKGVDPEDTENAELIIIWGANIVSTNIHQWIYANKAREKGAKIVVIDVHKNRTATLADQFIQIRPATDGALALGVMHVLISENLYDEDFVNDFTIGFEQLAQHVRAYDPQTVADITGLTADQIIQLAREYGTTRKSFIRIGNGLQHHYNGGMAVRNIACLPGLTGAWKYPGCGAVKGNSEYFKNNKRQLERIDLDVSEARTINMNQLGNALNHLHNPGIHALFVYNSNPVIVAPDQNQIIAGLQRDDLFTVVHDQFITDTARYADIVLPAPTSVEYLDVYRSYWHLYVQLSEPVIPLQGQSLPNTELFRRLAERFGFNEPCFADSDEQLVIQALDKMCEGKTGEQMYALLREQKYIKLSEDDESFFANGSSLPTPSGKIEFDSQVMQNKGLPSLPSFTDIKHLSKQDCTEYPLTLLNVPNHMFLNSSMANLESSQSFEGTPFLEMHPQDAADRGITDQSLVEIYNRLGNCCLPVKITDTVPQCTVVSQGLWWNEFYGESGNLNQLVSQDLSDMGNGAVFFSTFVQVKASENHTDARG